MNIVEFIVYVAADYIAPVYPFVYSVRPSVYSTANFWTSVFGAPVETGSYQIAVEALYRYVASSDYAEQSSLGDCKSQEQSFYFDESNQRLYIHVEHEYANYLSTDIYKYGEVRGATDEGVVYLDDIEYLPLVKSIPSIAQSADLAEYDRLAFITGTIEYLNLNAIFDYLINENIYGNSIFSKRLPSGGTSRTDLVDLAAFFIEDYDFTLAALKIAIQDKRKAQNITIPSLLFSATDYPDIDPNIAGNPVPLAYGTIRVSKAYPIDSEAEGDVTFRQAQALVGVGTVQVLVGETWTTVTPSSSTAATGTFTLDYEDCREEGAIDGTVLECRVLASEGIANTYASDVIKDLNDRELNITYNASNYDTTEWEAEETALTPIGVLFDTEIKLYDAIRQIQAGSNVGFRYEIAADGRRTIRIDDWDRTKTMHVYKEEIHNIDSIPVESEKDLLAAEVKINYAQDYYSGDFLSYLYDDEKETIYTEYGQQPRSIIDTLLTNETNAQARALWTFARYSTIPRVAKLELHGERFLTLRIYDIISAELTTGFVDLDAETITGGREYFGVWKLGILAIDPDLKNTMNVVEAVLIERIF
jgi:hypothetical protein